MITITLTMVTMDGQFTTGNGDESWFMPYSVMRQNRRVNTYYTTEYWIGSVAPGTTNDHDYLYFSLSYKTFMVSRRTGGNILNNAILPAKELD